MAIKHIVEAAKLGLKGAKDEADKAVNGQTATICAGRYEKSRNSGGKTIEAASAVEEDIAKQLTIYS